MNATAADYQHVVCFRFRYDRDLMSTFVVITVDHTVCVGSVMLILVISTYRRIVCKMFFVSFFLYRLYLWIIQISWLVWRGVSSPPRACTKTRNNETKPSKRNHRKHRNENTRTKPAKHWNETTEKAIKTWTKRSRLLFHGVLVAILVVLA